MFKKINAHVKCEDECAVLGFAFFMRHNSAISARAAL